MTDKTKRAIYAAALARYGAKLQFVVALEEMAELSKEIAKCLRENMEDPGAAARRPQIIEEIADVKNMLAQVEYTFGVEAEVDKMVAFKLTRLASRMGISTKIAGRRV